MTSKEKSLPTGDCFEAAGRFVREPEVADYPDDYRLVHGNVAKLRQNETVNHAWVEEEDEIVHDVSNGKCNVYLKKLYYEKHQMITVSPFRTSPAAKSFVCGKQAQTGCDSGF